LPRISIGLSTGRVNVKLFGAPQRQAYGPLVELVEVLFPDAAERSVVLENAAAVVWVWRVSATRTCRI
jgi:hypothetical protein